MAEISTIQTEKILYKRNIKLPKPNKEQWYVYILECKNGSFYTGVTNNLKKRMKTHAEGKGSKYVKAKGFKQLLRFKKCKNKSDACKAEFHIKTLQKYDKLDWFKSSNSEH